jgi:hypothetical protein
MDDDTKNNTRQCGRCGHMGYHHRPECGHADYDMLYRTHGEHCTCPTFVEPE